MPARLKASLAYPVVTQARPSRTLVSFLDAVTYLHEHELATGDSDAAKAVDWLMMAAASEDPRELEQATRDLDQLLQAKAW